MKVGDLKTCLLVGSISGFLDLKYDAFVCCTKKWSQKQGSGIVMEGVLHTT